MTRTAEGSSPSFPIPVAQRQSTMLRHGDIGSTPVWELQGCRSTGRHACGATNLWIWFSRPQVNGGSSPSSPMVGSLAAEAACVGGTKSGNARTADPKEVAHLREDRQARKRPTVRPAHEKNVVEDCCEVGSQISPDQLACVAQLVERAGVKACQVGGSSPSTRFGSRHG